MCLTGRLCGLGTGDAPEDQPTFEFSSCKTIPLRPAGFRSLYIKRKSLGADSLPVYSILLNPIALWNDGCCEKLFYLAV